MNEMNHEWLSAHLEDELCRYFDRKYCCVTGRGTTALYLALKSLPAKTGSVVLPAVVCPSPVNAALYAGFEPLFCDVSLRDFNIDPESLEQVLSSNGDVVAVVPVHLYGNPADMHTISNIARMKGVYVIEDAAQGMGGEYMGQKLGSFGDLSVVSFGHTKIVDVGWGGAVLTDDETLSKRIKQGAEDVADCPPNINQMFEEYRQVYYTLRSLVELNQSLHELFLPLPSIYRDMYLFSLPAGKAGEILSHLPLLEESIRRRRQNAEEYRKRLQHQDILHPVLKEGAAPWRYSVLLPDDKQRQVTEGLRQAGVDASNWYPALHRWYEWRRPSLSCLKNAEIVEKRILNLWVEPSVSPDYIDRACRTLLQILDDKTSYAKN